MLQRISATKRINTHRMVKLPPILQVGDVLISSDILTEEFCCDLEVCHGICCVEGDAGAPVSLDEVMEIENSVDAVWSDLSASAQAVIDKQDVAYTDEEGDLVTSIVGGKDCVFTCYDDLELSGNAEEGSATVVKNCCLCALEKHVVQGGRSLLSPLVVRSIPFVRRRSLTAP